MPPKKLQGQVAIITGAGRGIGAAAAERFVAAGASVVLTARSEEELEAVAARLRKQGGRAVAVPGDITDPQDVEEVVESALEQFDRVDVLVNNAGIIWPIDELADSDADEWTYNIFTNLVGPYVMARNVLPLMLEQGRGRIINVSSAAAEVAVPGASAYCAAKGRPRDVDPGAGRGTRGSRRRGEHPAARHRGHADAGGYPQRRYERHPARYFLFP